MEAREFGEYLKSLRKKKKLTIRQLDTYSGVSNSYISQMERGDRGVPKPDILQKLSKPLGVTYEELMEKAGYISKDGAFKIAVHEKLFKIDDDSDEFTKDIFKMITEDTDLFLESLNENPEFKTKFLGDIFDSEEGLRFLYEISKSNTLNSKAKVIIDEIDNLSEDDKDDVIDFIRYKKNRSKDK